jgi:hypothetical protein
MRLRVRPHAFPSPWPCCNHFGKVSTILMPTGSGLCDSRQLLEQVHWQRMLDNTSSKLVDRGQPLCTSVMALSDRVRTMAHMPHLGNAISDRLPSFYRYLEERTCVQMPF